VSQSPKANFGITDLVVVNEFHHPVHFARPILFIELKSDQTTDALDRFSRTGHEEKIFPTSDPPCNSAAECQNGQQQKFVYQDPNPQLTTNISGSMAQAIPASAESC